MSKDSYSFKFHCKLYKQDFCDDGTTVVSSFKDKLTHCVIQDYSATMLFNKSFLYQLSDKDRQIIRASLAKPGALSSFSCHECSPKDYDVDS